MVIFHDSRRFELTVEAHYDEWVARLLEFVPGRLLPTRHVLRSFAARQAAIEALVHKWHMLFPADEALVWREPMVVHLQRPAKKRRRPSKDEE